MRILWENKAALEPRGGRIVNNLVYWDSSLTGTEIQVGDSVSTASTFDLENNLWIGWRAYLEPSTKVGPALTEIVYDQAIVFRGE